jgi:hypothetical protein
MEVFSIISILECRISGSYVKEKRVIRKSVVCMQQIKTDGKI